MRLTCPLCGNRDRREFYYYGAADYLNRPGPEAGDAEWDDYLHLRDNPAGVTRDLWFHELGCSAWLLVTRNTLTHAVLETVLVADHQGRNAKFVYQAGDLREIPSPAVPPARAARKGATPPPKPGTDGTPPPSRPRAPRKGKGEPT